MSDTKVNQLRSYLREQVKSGTCYLKSRDVAKDIPEMTPKQIGTLLRELSEDDEDLEDIDISKWAGGSKAMTWRISSV